MIIWWKLFIKSQKNKIKKNQIYQKKTKKKNIQKLKDELDSCKQNFEKNENSYIFQINALNKEIEDYKLEKEKLEENINEIKMNKNKENKKWDKKTLQKVTNKIMIFHIIDILIILL